MPFQPWLRKASAPGAQRLDLCEREVLVEAFEEFAPIAFLVRRPGNSAPRRVPKCRSHGAINTPSLVDTRSGSMKSTRSRLQGCRTRACAQADGHAPRWPITAALRRSRLSERAWSGSVRWQRRRQSQQSRRHGRWQRARVGEDWPWLLPPRLLRSPIIHQAGKGDLKKTRAFEKNAEICGHLKGLTATPS
jgi:hypothetical protein